MWKIKLSNEHEVYFDNIEDAKRELTHIRRSGSDGFILKEEV